MSLFRFIASDKPLPEVDQSGFTKLKVRDLKRMIQEKIIPMPKSPLPLDKLDDDSEVLYAASESDIGGLKISICKNPPTGLERYITKEYIYWMEGRLDSKCINQLKMYLKTNLQKENKVELWSILFGDEFVTNVSQKTPLMELTDADLVWLRDHECCCLTVE
ncbi:hypothetical protein GJ688_16380 [Heliobacillus mobilis]|uniref:Uncharacterized protein n=1 Tax=Heliobacterium mobile TaxID=28064 RepID=A0A6I3SNC1_HELMO|nr:hypothetical protein [Heliobacterium mobile]MTV50523.1 hypothetical protein [Heliobacterium mobile]